MRGKRFEVGEMAPVFQGELWNGSTFDLEAYKGRKTWLAFFRYASCPLCNLRVHEMIQRHETLKKCGLEVVTVFQSPRDSVTEYVGKQEPPFPLICDPSEKLYSLYGLEASTFGFLHPGNLPLLRVSQDENENREAEKPVIMKMTFSISGYCRHHKT